jgi:RNA polymerase sigma-70 factor (ECF subfamily)
MLYSPLVEPAQVTLQGAADAELARRITAAPAGEAADAEAELYRRLAPRVYLYGLRHLRNEAAAADLVQQVLLITIEGLRAGRLQEPEKLVSFVLGTSRMVSMDLKRSSARRERLLEQFGRDLPAAAPPPVPDLDRAQLTQCLERLAERERSVVVMTFYDEQSGEEVAAFLGVSAANVRVIRYRALSRLRECMGAFS